MFPNCLDRSCPIGNLETKKKKRPTILSLYGTVLVIASLRTEKDYKSEREEEKGKASKLGDVLKS